MGTDEACGEPAEWLLPVVGLPDRQLFCLSCGMRLGSSGLADTERGAEAEHVRAVGVPRDVLELPPAWYQEQQWRRESQGDESDD